MLARRARPSAILAGVSVTGRAIRRAARISPPANGMRMRTLVSRSSLEPRNVPCVFSGLRTLFPFRELQIAFFQQAPNSLTQLQNITIAFSITSAPLVRSFAQERKLTPLPSCACARFCGNGGGAAKFVLDLDCQDSLLSSGGRVRSDIRSLTSSLANDPSPERNIVSPLVDRRRVA
jgi:hypothetical protein